MYKIYRYENKDSQPLIRFASNQFSVIKKAYLDMIEKDKGTESVIVMYCANTAINTHYSNRPQDKIIVKSN